MNSFVITEPVVRKLLETVDAGLVSGLGTPEPGKMCVEAAISYALGEPHSDGPSCVDAAVRYAKIALNDAAWSSPVARARGMRRVAIAQLGSKDTINPIRFVALLAEYTIREVVPVALRSAAVLLPTHAISLEAVSVRCEQEGTNAAANAAANAANAAAYATAKAAANAAANAANAAAYATNAAANTADAAYAERDRVLSLSASLMVRVLRECGSPGCAWLWLVDETEVRL